MIKVLGLNVSNLFNTIVAKGSNSIIDDMSNQFNGSDIITNSKNFKEGITYAIWIVLLVVAIMLVFGLVKNILLYFRDELDIRGREEVKGKIVKQIIGCAIIAAMPAIFLLLEYFLVI